ncbi:amino acid ABC transporter permease [Herbaspirillum sp. GW103]|uniref:amino acid ABC transporter permease n=1 Tax=unclassified Herbaspirillum TaxID=2624150 RepID=UPI00025E45F7|nr:MULTISPECIES: amino acid ABC transporter permease [unclassified Herbaspirillum]EIJ46228.1 amino acid ABC transporter permease [Herbaspirillum sp. GW103]MCI1003622.1 amino acid ABC transporter permease [Herbaspirillum sp. C7C8]
MNAFSFLHVEYLLQAAVWTVVLSLVAFVFGGVAGFVIALWRVSPNALLRGIASTYIQVVQGIPLLVILFVAYFGLAIAGLKLTPLVAAGISFAIYCAAFLGEIWRGCIQAVPKTQWEASECLGFNRFEQLTKVILPQAIKIATPPTVGFMVQIVKNTSLASVIGFVDLSRAGQIINNSTFQPFTVFGCVALIYFCLCFPLSALSKHFERKLNVSHR